MSTLPELQAHFLAALYHDESGLSPQLDISTRSAQQQIQIYRDSIFGGLSKALANIYPVSVKLVGQTFFDALCLRYIQQTPSLSPDVNDYGQGLADFTQGFAPAQSLVYLPDTMRLEWAWHQALQSADDPQADLQTLMSLDPEAVLHSHLILTGTGTLVRSDYPIDRIWQTNQDDYDGDDTIELDNAGVALFVWRQHKTLRMDVIDDALYDFLYQLQQKKPLPKSNTPMPIYKHR